METKRKTIWVVCDAHQIIKLFNKKNDAVALFEERRKYYDGHKSPTESDHWVYFNFYTHTDGEYKSIYYVANCEGHETERFALTICEKEVL